MDIALLSKMLGELVLDHDEVTLPGLGSFVAEVVPASFSDKGYTINPPYRRLSFRSRETGDTLLTDLYAGANKISQADAKSILTPFLGQLRDELQSRKTVVLPGLGRLRATKENNFFFIPDEDLNIYPEGFALKPVSLKTHVETPEEVSAALAGLKALTSQRQEESVPVAPEEPHASADASTSMSEAAAPQDSAEAVSLQEPEAVDKKKAELYPHAHHKYRYEPYEVVERKHSKGKAFVVTLLSLVAAVILFFGGFILLSRYAPDFTDSLLYTPEELEILNYPDHV